MTGIVVGVDGSEHSGIALAWAADEAERRGEPLTAIMAWGLLDQHHADPGAPFDPHYGEHHALDALDAAITRAVGPERGRSIERMAVCDLAAPALIRASTQASLLVVGARGHGGFTGLLLGSVSQHCLHHATCAVAVVRKSVKYGGDTMRIVVGIDGSETARHALRWALEEAKLRAAKLEVVHAWNLPYVGGYPYTTAAFDPVAFEGAAQQTLDDAVAGIDSTGVEIEPILVAGDAASAILDAAKDADMVVIGSRGLGGFAGLLLGSVSHHVAHHTRCPVVIVPPEL